MPPALSRGGMEEARPHPQARLYGSHARDDWVDDAAGGYRSDYDILVVVRRHLISDWIGNDERLIAADPRQERLNLADENAG